MRIKQRFIILLFLLVTLLSACASPPATAPTATLAEPTQRAQVLVNVEWVVNHLEDPAVRLIDVSSGRDVYGEGHLPGAVFVDWKQDLTDPENPVQGQVPLKWQVEALLSDLGVTREDTIVLYDDTASLFAARAFWVFDYYGHESLRILDGGRSAWTAEGQELTVEVPAIDPSEYVAEEPDTDIRASVDEVRNRLEDGGTTILDARSPKEFAGTDVRSARGGHIPGAVNIEWSNAVGEDGTFKPTKDLQALYQAAGFSEDQDVLTYCQTGVRAAHTWFVLKYLLGYSDVQNYDGSWEEWGNQPDLPLER